MRRGPAFPAVKGLVIEWFNETQWPTERPLFYGTCDDDADVSVPGVVRVLSEQDYLSMRETETANKGSQVRAHRDFLLRTEVDAFNPIRWEAATELEKEAVRVYRAALLDVPQQEGFPWTVEWPQPPSSEAPTA